MMTKPFVSRPSCAVCGKTFAPHRHGVLICSDACRLRRKRESAAESYHRALGPVQPIPCAVCGKTFTPVRRGRASALCSDACRKQRASDAEKQAKEAFLLASGPTLCVACGKPFQPETRSSTVCSDACRKERAKEARKKWAQKHERTTNAAGDVVCAVCGKTFAPKSHNARMCSQKCASEKRRQRWAQHQKAYQDAAPERACVACGKPFRTHSIAKKACSEACAKLHKNLASNKRRKVQRAAAKRKTFARTCVVCAKNFTTIYPLKIVCSEECSRRRSAKMKTELHRKRALAEGRTLRSSPRTREQMQAEAPKAKAKTIPVVAPSPTLKCTACGRETAREASVLGCCSPQCADALLKAVSVRTMEGERLCVNARVNVMRFEKATIGGVERLIQRSDRGVVVGVSPEGATVRFLNEDVFVKRSDVEEPASPMQRVRAWLEKQESRNYKERFRRDAPVAAE